MNKPDKMTHRLPALFAALALCAGGSLQTVLAQEPAAAPATAAEAAAPAATEPAAADTAAAPAAAPEAATEAGSAAETTPAAAEPTQHVPARLRYRDREFQNSRIAALREANKLRQENMERWRSARRWWINPAAEDRRQWNKARSQWHRDMIEARRKYDEQIRPDYDFRYRYWRVYP